MSSFERYAAQRVVELAQSAGLTVSPEVASTLGCSGGSYAGRRWAELHPDDQAVCHCWGFALDGPESCTCWRPVFLSVQLEPRPPASPDDVQTAAGMCSDCAFRKGSPERAEEWTEGALMDLAATGKPFWCHQGMRRPDFWEHPDGRRVEGSTDDWQPPTVAGVPFRLDGSPGLLCAGWAAHGRRYEREAAAEAAAEEERG